MKQLSGVVTSAKMPQTVVVTIETRWQHPVYKKTIRKSKNFLAHDPIGVKVGDTVSIRETRPISRLKHWIVIEPETVKTTKTKK
jgi:small subunit ribosomal protein S17